MNFLSNKKNAPVLIGIATLAVGGAIWSGVHSFARSRASARPAGSEDLGVYKPVAGAHVPAQPYSVPPPSH